MLLKAASTLGRMPSDEGLRVILDLLGEILAYDRASVMLVAQPGTLRVAAHVGFTDDPNDEAIQNVQVNIKSFTYLKRLFDTRAPQLVSDTTTYSRLVPRRKYLPGSYGAPLIVHDQVLGCLSISHDQPGRF